MDLTIHRGAHEIGGSCVELRSASGNTRLILDIGMPLVEADGTPFDWKNYKSLPPAVLLQRGVLPRVEGLYEWEDPSVSAVVLSHGQQDHYGFLRFVHPSILVYMSRGTKSLIEVSNLFLGTDVHLEPIRTLDSRKPPVVIGDFAITPRLMDHSAPDAMALLVEGDGRSLFYTGDLRGHGRKGVLFEDLVKNPPTGVDCLLMEGTMLGRGEGLFKDEDAIETVLYQRFRNQRSGTVVMCSSQNLDRIVSVYRAAKRGKKTLVIDLYTAFVLDKLTAISRHIPQFNWNDIRVVFPFSHARKLAEYDRSLLYKYNRAKIKPDELKTAPESYVLLGRDNSYFRRVLVPRLSVDTPPAVVYSMWRGYLERGNLPAFLRARDIELVEVHTSGHAYVQDLERLAAAMQPKRVVPIHTFRASDYQAHFSDVVLLDDGMTRTI